MQELPSTLDKPAHRRPWALSPGNGGRSAGRSPRASAGSGGPGGAPPRTRGLRPSRLGRGRSRQSCRGWLGYARRGADGDSPVPRGPSRGLGPWTTAEWPWSPTDRRCTVLPEGNWSQAATGPGPGWGTRSCARRRTRLSWLLVPSLAVSPNPAPALRPLGALGSHPGAQVPQRRERVVAKAPADCRPPRALSALALRSGTELGGARRALFPRFPKGHPGGGAP